MDEETDSELLNELSFAERAVERGRNWEDAPAREAECRKARKAVLARMDEGADLRRAIRDIAEQARGLVRHDDADRTGVCIHAGLLRTLVLAAGLKPLPISPAVQRARDIRAATEAPAT